MEAPESEKTVYVVTTYNILVSLHRGITQCYHS